MDTVYKIVVKEPEKNKPFWRGEQYNIVLWVLKK